VSHPISAQTVTPSIGGGCQHVPLIKFRASLTRLHFASCFLTSRFGRVLRFGGKFNFFRFNWKRLIEFGNDARQSQ
jgi:hypothetical protein